MLRYRFAMLDIVNLAAYKFCPLEDLKRHRAELRQLCRALRLKGTILLSREGINLFVAGTRSATDRLLAHLRQEPLLTDLEVKESLSDDQPFSRMLVKIKKEIIAFGHSVDPAEGRKVAPGELRQWLDEGREVALLDVRNDYEVRMGTFEGALDLNIGHFRDFPERVRELPSNLKKQPIVMFCTGGIRCEKAGPWMQQLGFDQVFQLEGGILKYFEECQGQHYTGDCFVFDQRVALDPHLQETASTSCYVCQEPLTPEQQQSEKYVPGKSCPYCYRTPEEARAITIQQREQAISRAADPLPGSVPYDNLRPMNVPERCDRMSLIDFLTTLHPHRSRDDWAALCREGRIVKHGIPTQADDRVRAGERYCHLIPASVEPEVSPAIRILYEDDCLVVVNKPAPLPVHPSGRYNRNTLGYLLDQVYRPEKLRPAHRLDANTTGVLVLCRTRHIAALVQPQFERGEVRKSYLARIVGQPPEDNFDCEAPIGRETTEAGARLVQAGGLSARTEFHVLKRCPDGTSLLEARPITGRTNQIRLHLWHLGWPIQGDPVYLPQGKLGAQQTLRPTDPPLCLHAQSIQLTHPTRGKTIRFEAPLPDWVGC